jgi:hypothetical protein
LAGLTGYFLDHPLNPVNPVNPVQKRITKDDDPLLGGY